MSGVLSVSRGAPLSVSVPGSWWRCGVLYAPGLRMVPSAVPGAALCGPPCNGAVGPNCQETLEQISWVRTDSPAYTWLCQYAISTKPELNQLVIHGHVTVTCNNLGGAAVSSCVGPSKQAATLLPAGTPSTAVQVRQIAKSTNVVAAYINRLKTACTDTTATSQSLRVPRPKRLTVSTVANGPVLSRLDA